MNIQDILKPLTRDQLESLSKRDLIHLLLGEQDLRAQAEGWARALKEQSYRMGEYYVRVKNFFYGKRSEKSAKPSNDKPAPTRKGGSKEDLEAP